MNIITDQRDGEWRMIGRKWVLLSLFLFLSGCVSDGPQTIKSPEAAKAESASSDSENDEESQMFFGLIGSKRQDLIDKLGPPDMTMDVTLIGRPASEGYLYYSKTGKGCVNTFVIVEESEEIVDYFCR